MTNEEKELLYEEFKARLSKETRRTLKGERRKKMMYFLSEAREHFNRRQDYWISNFRHKGAPDSLIISYGWDEIRKLVCWSYCVCQVEDLPDERKEEINKFTIDLIDRIYDKLEEIQF